MGNSLAIAVPQRVTPLAAPAPASAVGRFERLPKWLNCVPLVAQWLWLGLRFRSLSLPSAANPHITCGGMVGEGKLEYFDAMGELAKTFIAPYAAITVTGSDVVIAAFDAMKARGLAFPVVAKPNLGWCGYGVRKLSTIAQLALYLKHFPLGETVLLQRYLPQEEEAGLFYMRRPGEATGRITGVTLRSFPHAVGDGVRTLAQLIAADERLARLGNKLHQSDFDAEKIPAKGESVRLALIGSTRVGGLYRDGADCITPELTGVIDAIARDMKEFYVGRFDVRFESQSALKSGKGFTIMEVNGSGSEAVHAWDPKYSIAESYRIIFEKQRRIFEIGAENRRNGHKPVGAWELAKLHLRQQRLIKRYPPSN